MTQGTNVLLEKLSAHKVLADMLPTGYWLRGHLREAPTIGHTLQVNRYERAAQTPDETTPVRCAGDYVSSPVQEILEGDDGVVTVITAHSRWRITPIAQ
jgi:hypothetical protein